MKVTALAGGVGGAKLLIGLQSLLRHKLTAVVNVGDDDDDVYGLRVSPDIDIVTYWLAGIADRAKGWGIEGDTSHVVTALSEIGVDAWFGLGDRDLATCLYRTERLREGARLSEVTRDVAASLGVTARVLPSTDDRVRTTISTADGRTLSFQEYFVRERHRPEVVHVAFEGANDASPAPGVLEAIRSADRVVICPSNPHLSIAPILAVQGIRGALEDHADVVAVTPIVKGAALKGPADRVLRALGGESSAAGVARLYAGICRRFVVDALDEREVNAVRATGAIPLVCDTIMRDGDASERLARDLLAA